MRSITAIMRPPTAVCRRAASAAVATAIACFAPLAHADTPPVPASVTPFLARIARAAISRRSR